MSQRHCSCQCRCLGENLKDECPHSGKRSAASVSTFRATIHLAGDVDTAKRWLRRFAYDHGACVTVTPITFIYTGGEEAGLQVGLVNYPRFPKQPQEIHDLAVRLARGLVVECCQRTALVVSDLQTDWVVIEPPRSDT